MNNEILVIGCSLALLGGYVVLSWLTKKPEGSGFLQYIGKLKDENYHVEQWSDSFVTISVDLKEELPSPFEIGISNLLALKLLDEDPKSGAIHRLIKLGITSLDAGYHSNWIAAEMPIEKTTSTKEKDVAVILLELKKLLQEPSSIGS